MLTETASIGQANLRNVLTYAPNHTRLTTTRVLDERMTGCFACPKKGSDPSACDHCTDRVYLTTVQKVYINERAKYGAPSSPMKRTACLLFLYLHFQNPDHNGLITYFDAEDAASYLGVTARTIKANLLTLQRNGYVSFRGTDIPYHFDVFLTGYQDYFLPAKKGGRGYVIFSKELFHHALSCRTIMELRVFLRSYLDASDMMRKNGTIVTRSFRDIKSQLPAYCPVGKIKAIMNGDVFSSVFEVLSEKRKTTMRLRPEYGQTKLRDTLVSECRSSVEALINDLNNARTEKDANAAPLHVSVQDLEDTAKIALKYPVKAVTLAIREIFRDYVETRDHRWEIESFGALVRSYTSQLVRFEAAA